ncbi:MAG: transporter permease, partial [Rhodoferax sp.]|nr:transporter permease [Rhodoferax sp.]
MGSLYSEHRTWLHAVPAIAKLLALALLGTGLFLTDLLAIQLPVAALCSLLF